MCGINGFNFNDPTLIAKMNDIIKHRGPDDDGSLSVGTCSLGNTRLAILDLSPSGHQPMVSSDKNITLVFNGEIYNFGEIRSDLIKKGHTFKSNSDTEVIIKAYEAYGTECLNFFNGVFAFALYDKSKDFLFVTRDRLGVKPLYYFWDNTKFIFSSEIKAILAHTIPRAIDEEAFALYWRLLYVPSPLTMFKGIKKLEPGKYLALQNNSLHKVTYWNPAPGKELTFSDALVKTRELVSESVNLQLISDRPIGVFLSGGVDSTIITGLVAKFKGQGVKTFSAGFDIAPEKFSVDSALAKTTSAIFGTDHTNIIVTAEDCATHFNDVVRHMDEPVSNATQVATYLLSKEAKSKVSVVLGGDGGDELFGGYERYHASRQISRLQTLPLSVLKIISQPLKFFGKSGRDNIEKILSHPGVDRYLQFMSQKEIDIAQVLKSKFNSAFVTKKFIAERFFRNSWPDTEKQFMWTDTASWLPEESLVRSDKMSMAFGVEMRVPFLDHRLAELSLSIKTSSKIHGHIGKYILRKAFSEYMLPHIIDAPKRGWFSPASTWLRTTMRPTMKAALDPAFNPGISDRFNFLNISKMYQDHCNKDAYHMNILWAFMTFQVWYHEFFTSKN